jgi:two-component system response regulator YesN
MIVEDEKPIRIGIRHMLEEFFAENAHLHYEIAESSSGRDAYRRCTSGVVDILITDIKMPAMSGISLAKKLVREQLPIHMLAVSGYQDYEYVREMMKLGVHDYLIKPIDRAQLYESMEYFVTHLYAPQSREKESMLAEQRMVERILLGACDSHKELDQYLARRGLDRNVPCEVLLIREDPTQREQPFGLYYALCARFGDDPNLALVQGELDGSWVVIAAGSGLTEAHVNALADQIARAGHSVTARLGPVALRDANSLNAQHRLSFFDLFNPPPEGLDAQAALDQIVEVMAGAERSSRLEEAVGRLFAAYQAGKAPADSIKKDVSGLMYQLMSKCADYIEFIGKTRFTRYDLMECFEDASSLSEIKKGVLEALAYLLEQFRDRCESSADTVFAAAKSYIQVHYAEPLQLNDVAAVVHLHPNYFSTLFRQKLGLTFREYLRRVRIEAAIGHIQGEKLSIEDIAAKVGYSDTAHFLRAFKGVTGTTPKAYKRS